MGCNCKNKNKQVSIQETITQEIIETKKIALETIEEIERLVNSINSDQNARNKVADFFKATFGEVLTNYCDQVCKKRLITKLGKLKTEL